MSDLKVVSTLIYLCYFSLTWLFQSSWDCLEARNEMFLYFNPEYEYCLVLDGYTYSIPFLEFMRISWDEFKFHAGNFTWRSVATKHSLSVIYWGYWYSTQLTQISNNEYGYYIGILLQFILGLYVRLCQRFSGKSCFHGIEILVIKICKHYHQLKPWIKRGQRKHSEYDFT